MYRIGQGYDVHAFTRGDHIMLGGVKIPHHRGIRAHSDGDVLLHAVCDALLGALALGDIGQHFPDTNEDFADADSAVLTRTVMAMVVEAGWQVLNLDTTVIAQAPKLAPNVPAMRESLAAVLDAPLNCISVKATTNEGLGFIGREEGIAVQAVVLLEVAS